MSAILFFPLQEGLEFPRVGYSRSGQISCNVFMSANREETGTAMQVQNALELANHSACYIGCKHKL